MVGIGIAVSGGIVVQQVLLSFGRVARELMLPAGRQNYIIV